MPCAPIQRRLSRLCTTQARLNAGASQLRKRGSMALMKNEFAVLAALANDEGIGSQRDLADAVGLSLGTVNKVYRSVADRGEVDGYRLTDAGWKALAPYKVDNAIIMAAGLSSRFAPISYERPKGVLKVRGEVLIERQIRQLKEAGINDITVVVGYKKEHFFCLEDTFGVSIVVNPDYAERNNNSTLMAVADRLGNTYICSSDDYFTENPFRSYEWKSFYSVQYESGRTEEWCVKIGATDRLVGVAIGGHDAWVMMGHAYFDRAFSDRFIAFLREDYDKPETADKLWESVMMDHIDELDMVVKRYSPSIIFEFDSLDEVRDFDPAFIENVDSRIFGNICSVLGCEPEDIRGIVPIKQGLTNLSFRFMVDGGSYVYRHPGAGTDAIINRASEAISQRVAADLGIDGTFIYEDEDEGWKISRFVIDARPLDYHDEDDLVLAMSIARKLHASGADSGFAFDIHEDTKKTIALLDAKRRTAFHDFKDLYALADELDAMVKADGLPPVLCHNDFYPPNFLVTSEEIDLIDWEYSGMSDYASDLAVFICCSDYTYDEAMHVLEVYFGRPLTPEELFHCVAYICVVSFHWFIWALYQDMCGSPVGELLYLYYKYTKLYGTRAKEMAKDLNREMV